MSNHQTAAIIVQAEGSGAPFDIRLRRALKWMLRTHGLRAVRVSDAITRIGSEAYAGTASNPPAASGDCSDTCIGGQADAGNVGFRPITRHAKMSHEIAKKRTK